MSFDELARYRAFFETHDVAGRQQQPPATNGSYELRTPVNAIIGLAEVLEEEHFGALTLRQRAYVRAILSAAHHLLAVVRRKTQQP